MRESGRDREKTGEIKVENEEMKEKKMKKKMLKMKWSIIREREADGKDV